MCATCGGTPCDWKVYGDEVLRGTNSIYEAELEQRKDLDNKIIRYSVYLLFMYMKYGHLIKRRRIKIS